MEIGKMEPLPYTVAVIKPDTASSTDKVENILKKIEDAGLHIYERESRVLDREDAMNLFAKFKNRDFYHDLIDYMQSGPCEILLLTMNSGNPIRVWKDLIGPSDPIEAKVKNPASLRALYGVSLLKNEFHGSDDHLQSNRERDIFDFPVPVREPDFIFDSYKISTESLMKFIFPPHLEHSNVTGRLDIFGMYGPIVNYHSVDLGCFCLTCSRLGKQKLSNGAKTFKKGKLAEPARRLLHEQEILDLWSELCENCRYHCDNYSHLASGRNAQHLLTDIEITQLIREMNKNEIEEMLTATKGSAAKTIILTLDLTEPVEILYNAAHVRGLFDDLDTDYFRRMNFYDMQKRVFDDRNARMAFWLSKITGIPVENLKTRHPVSKKKEAEESRMPMSLTIIDKPLTQVGTNRDPSIVDQPKLGPNAQKVALLKRMHREGFLIGDGKDLNSIDTANNVRLLRNYAPGRHGGWDNYFAIKNPESSTTIYKKKHKK